MGEFRVEFDKMEKFKFFKRKNISKLPKATGVYVFYKANKLLYIGKAKDIRKRVKNHFSQLNYKYSSFLDEINKVGFTKTGSEIEALILEASLIKKHQPKYNIMWKDDKGFFYTAVTKQELPRIFITHQPKEQKTADRGQGTKRKIQNTKFIGPFVGSSALKKTLKILRKIFPYYSTKKHSKNPCPWCHLNLCPGPSPDKKEYKKAIKYYKKSLELNPRNINAETLIKRMEKKKGSGK